MNEIQLQQKHSCYKGENLLLKHIKMFFNIFLESFQLKIDTHTFFSKSKYVLKKIKRIFYLFHYHDFFSFYYALNNIYKAFSFIVR